MIVCWWVCVTFNLEWTIVLCNISVRKRKPIFRAFGFLQFSSTATFLTLNIFAEKICYEKAARNSFCSTIFFISDVHFEQVKIYPFGSLQGQFLDFKSLYALVKKICMDFFLERKNFVLLQHIWRLCSHLRAENFITVRPWNNYKFE